MNRKERREIAKQIIKLDKKCEKGNNILENSKSIEILIEKCSIQDLLEIDEMIMKKYLTN